MTKQFVITATDTDVGKTVFAAALTQALHGIYYKPVQAGLAPATDTQTVRRLTGLPDAHFLPERYRLRTPASPHIAARIDGLEIDIAALALPALERHLIIEGAGGLLVPLTRQSLFIDVFARWNAPIVLCARTALGAINHALLSIEALKRRSLSILGIVFIGDENAEVEETISQMGGVHRLGRLPWLPKLDAEALAGAFHAHFRLQDFLQGDGVS